MGCCALSDNIRTIRAANNGGIIRIQLNQGADMNSVKYLTLSTTDSSRKRKLHEHTTVDITTLTGTQNTRLLSLRLAPLRRGISELNATLCCFSDPCTTLRSQTTRDVLLFRGSTVFPFLIRTLDM